MKLSTLIGALRERCPFFSRRVSGIAAYTSLPQSIETLPAAFVMLANDTVEAQQSATDYRQTVREAFAVIVVLDAAPALSGDDTAFDTMDEMKTLLWKALLAMRPDADSDIIVYAGGRLLEINGGQLRYQFDFTCDKEIHAPMTRQHEELAALDAFHTLAVDGDPLTADGRPDGNIDYRSVITLPT